jgi:hypothetical protein
MCHTRSRRHRTSEQALDRFDAPAPARVTRAVDSLSPARETGPLRVSDADREGVVTLLRDHAAAGRLDADELEERLERAYGARYSSELEAVLAELPREPSPRRARERHPVRPSAPGFAAVPLAIGALITLAVITGAWWLMWLIWPVVMVLGPRRHHHRGWPLSAGRPNR